MLSKTIITKFLTDQLGFDEEKIASLEKNAGRLQVPLDEFLLREHIADEHTLYTGVAQALGVQFVQLKGKEIPKEVLNVIPSPLASTHRVVPFEKTETTISLAMLDPEDVQTIDFIARKTGLTPTVHMTTPSEMRDALRLYHADIQKEIDIQSGASDEAGELKKVAEELPIINIVNSIVEHAVYEDASDIHIEPTEKEVIVRYRIDGILRQVMTLPKDTQNGIVARIKILANLKLDERMVPQDGRFKLQVQEERFGFRVSIIPVFDGEKIVMRLLKEGQKPLDLDQLGFLKEAKAAVQRAIKKPHGMLLVTGPTGSGKTTTLYSVLGILNKPGVNICTIEDPIEYHVQGINQSQVNARVGFTFASGLRAFLRQDPDIIMVGEIRDQETAEIAIHSAMTGHAVLSTLHTNDAPTTLPRLLDMGIPPFLVAFTTNLIIAQRLVRRLCDECKEPFTLEAGAVDELKRSFDTTKLVELFQKHEIELPAQEKDLESMSFYRGAGCKQCGDSGYKGRVGIYEVLEIDDTIIALINERATADKIKDHAAQSGMVTILQDGLVKAKQGVTTIEEVLRVTRE